MRLRKRKQKYEYKVVEQRFINTTEAAALNHEAQDGWRLFQVVTRGGVATRYIFERKA